ncbi:MAG TPA: 3-carboxy-cis,cis-muconate cycloisomerase [Jatrophihabitans sp.]|jgi:3-carboxy-cis,cis-muconate cycloisomerase|uniref:3-carboxy-cis,cis-muconate cycloisomerase n=1 Tax=Jatrophihabitans sp. TaxID=1932789 RepID=UPI002E0AC274|nr:3-carboxy-cis,cis-muconate cycloisomerase [Jatrophihabitans sp.]
MSVLFDPVFGMTAVDAAVDDRAWLAALCEVETALARACARAGLVDLGTALEIGAAADALARRDPAELGRAAQADGNPVIPLVRELRAAVGERAGEEAADAVHLGATSQDILDTAAMLITSRALGVIGADLGDAADHAAALARAHRDTAMTGRTLLQHAVPTTFGALAAGWGAGLDHARARLDAVRSELPIQYGGAAGTLAAVHPHGFDIVAALADELDLREPAGVWHAERSVVAELAGALGTASVALGKPATDIVLLAQTELGELRESSPGGSSAMAHKRNPIAAITARAAAAQAPGLVATLLASGAQELQRGAGGWHAEWQPLTALLRCVGGAASRLRASLAGLEVDPAAMARNLGADEPEVGHAGDLVDRYLDRRR